MNIWINADDGRPPVQTLTGGGTPQKPPVTLSFLFLRFPGRLTLTPIFLKKFLFRS